MTRQSNSRCIQRQCFYQNGLSLLESALVLILSAILIASVILYYQYASRSRDAEQTIMMLESIVADVNILYLSGADHHDISDNVIINSGILPQNFVRDNKIVSPAGMVFHLSSGSVSDPLNKQCWRISFVSSAELCPTLVNIHRSSNLIQVYLGGQHKLLNNYSTINQIVDACQHEKYTGSDGSQFVEMIWEIH